MQMRGVDIRESARYTRFLIYICRRCYACAAIIAIKYVTRELRRHNYTWEMITAATMMISIRLISKVSKARWSGMEYKIKRGETGNFAKKHLLRPTVDHPAFSFVIPRLVQKALHIAISLSSPPPLSLCFSLEHTASAYSRMAYGVTPIFETFDRCVAGTYIADAIVNKLRDANLFNRYNLYSFSFPLLTDDNCNDRNYHWPFSITAI